jgi:hypothetical protein
MTDSRYDVIIIGAGVVGRPEQGGPVKQDVTDLSTPFRPTNCIFVHLVASEQFGVITKTAQKAVEFPQGFRGAIEPTRGVHHRKSVLKNCHDQRVC